MRQVAVRQSIGRIGVAKEVGQAKYLNGDGSRGKAVLQVEHEGRSEVVSKGRF